ARRAGGCYPSDVGRLRPGNRSLILGRLFPVVAPVTRAAPETAEGRAARTMPGRLPRIWPRPRLSLESDGDVDAVEPGLRPATPSTGQRVKAEYIATGARCDCTDDNLRIRPSCHSERSGRARKFICADAGCA